jgi:hypothetical protein
MYRYCLLPSLEAHPPETSLAPHFLKCLDLEWVGAIQHITDTRSEKMDVWVNGDCAKGEPSLQGNIKRAMALPSMDG